MRFFGPILAGILRFIESALAAETVLSFRSGHILIGIVYIGGAILVGFGLWEVYGHIKPHKGK
ncbi:Uncharacterised protein [uncultured archaeon]|nr:Uncharacterised protein [uncultured archaeon]